MVETFTMTQDIVEGHKLRMLHLCRYYPFFKIMETSFGQYKEGKYSMLDMGYITLAILRFFMEENHFKDKEVTFSEYADFMEELLRRDFLLEQDEEQTKELVSFIFDKVKNDGKPFLFPYYDPIERKKLVMRMKLIDSRMENQTVYYSVTADAITFYLDTKELKDQSKITVEQMLLEKMIRSRNFRGGTEVARRINSEVHRLQAKKNEVLGILSSDVFEGIKAYEEFMDNGMKWFEEEQKLFEKNTGLIRFALEKAQADERRGEYESQYYKAVEEIYALEDEMKKALACHAELLNACMDLQKKADELVSRARLHALRPVFDFQKAVGHMMEQDRADKLHLLIKPLLKLNNRKAFTLRMIDEMLTYRPEKEEKAEAVEEGPEEAYIYEDEIEENRIVHNFQIFVKILFERLLKEKTFTLEEICKTEWKPFAKNGDFYTFLVHLGQKKDYRMKEAERSPDTFLEKIICDFLGQEANAKYRNIHLMLEMMPEEKIALTEMTQITNVRFSAEIPADVQSMETNGKEAAE